MQLSIANRVRVFISYSHKDDDLRKRLRTHLSQLEHDELVEAWDDRAIPGGEEWADEIDERLEQAEVILLLVSADFIHSKYCYQKEMKRALARNAAKEDRAIVVPVILRQCDWQTAPFAKLQALPRDGRPLTDWKSEDDYFAAVAKGLRERIVGLVEADQGCLTRIGARLRDPAWWQRPAVLTLIFALAALLAGAGGWWWTASSEVSQAISEATAMLRVGRYADAQTQAESACRRWLVGRPACFVCDKAALGAMLESQSDTLHVEQFAHRLDAIKAQHPTKDPDLLLFSGALALQTRDPQQRQHQVARAREIFNEAVTLDPRFAEGYYYLASIHLMNPQSQDDYDRARTQLNKAIDIAPHAPHYLNARAYARKRLGDLKGAEADYRQSADAGSIMSRLELAELLWLSGRFTAASDQQAKALEQIEQVEITGRNALPWVFELDPGRQLVLRAKQEKACYAGLAWQASETLLGNEMQPDRTVCGASGSEIARAVAGVLERAVGSGLPVEARPRAMGFARQLQRQDQNGKGD